MKALEDKILKEGKVLPGGILKIDGFLNHQIDVDFLNVLGKDVYEHFKDKNINKILTIEASGIGLACITALHFGCKVLVAKKHQSINISGDVWSAKAYSFTHQRENSIILSKEYLGKGDRVLIVDDFLACGNACVALKQIVDDAGAECLGVCCAVEKYHQGGHDRLTALGLDVYSLARVESMDEVTGVKFVK